MASGSITPLQVGDELPWLELLDQNGRRVNVRNVAETSTVLLFFYPRDDGPRCRTQACSMRDSWPLLRSEGIEVFGVNHMDVESHRRFRDRHALPYPLLVDDELRLSRAFGFTNEGLLQRIGVSPIERSTVIVDPGGRIRMILRNVKPTMHFDLLRTNLARPERAPDGDDPEPQTDEASAPA